MSNIWGTPISWLPYCKAYEKVYLPTLNPAPVDNEYVASFIISVAPKERLSFLAVLPKKNIGFFINSLSKCLMRQLQIIFKLAYDLYKNVVCLP